ncbi:MAG TPA: type II toxin-antitoxin system antitoxin SocA domain-containing protein [Candidatus Binatia bacterium]|nr:type II toxin-antitoxin system antitoxin SocA domain-containing protein [Candidatus Binatia bacterium]
MPYSAKAIANWFLKRDELSPMKLQKLVYFAHGWKLGLRGTPLINEEIEAWDYGPVVPDLYHEFKQFGSAPITAFATRWKLDDGKPRLVQPLVPPDAVDTQALLRRIWKVYGHKTGGQLSAITHLPDSPWSQIRRECNTRGAVIPNERIAAYFKRLAQRP